MTHGSLFSGIGGFDLAAEWMGWENVFHCEWNPFGQRVLKHYWPNAKSYHDITKTDFTVHRGSIDILTGGFPCQPYSTAGKRLGKEDERHLWPEMLRAIREIKPRWIVGENVYGLVNWSGGLVFDEVQSELEVEGFEVFPYVLPAASVGAPHRRDRVWFVAYAHNKGGSSGLGQVQKENGKVSEWNDHAEFSNAGFQSDASNSDNKGLEGRQDYRNNEKEKREGQQCDNSSRLFCTDFRDFPTKPALCFRDDGLPTELDSITFSKWRNESIKAGGNAIVPQVALQIFKTIQQFEHEQNHNRQE